MKSKKHIIILSALAVYTLAAGIYQYKVNNAALNDVLLTMGVMFVILVLLFFIFNRMERLREMHQLEEQMKDPTDDDEDDSAFRLPPDGNK